MSTNNTEVKQTTEQLKQTAEQLESLKLELKWRNMERELLIQIIKTNTDIPIDSIIERVNSNIHIYNYKDGKIPIIVHNIMKNEKEKDKKRKYSIRTERTKIYKTIKHKVELAEEKQESKSEEENEVVEPITDLIDLDTIQKKNAETLDNIDNNRIFNKQLPILRDLRRQIASILPLKEYISYLSKDIDKLTEIFNKKDYNGKKQKTIISTALTNLDFRLLYYGDYHTIHLTMDDIECFKKMINKTVHAREYVPFNKDDFVDRILNYGLALFPIENIIKDQLFNKHGYFNLIYVKIPKSLDSDPFSFYSLCSKTSMGVRNWNIESRLEDFVHDVVEAVLLYSISIFRKIYHDVYGDNDYREKFSKCPIMTEDVEQLLQNIYTISDKMEFTNRMRTLVMTTAMYKPTENDKFNLTGDDSIQYRRFKEHDKNNNELNHITGKMFDGICHKDINTFWLNRVV